jgi:hypothetical protein
MGGGSNTAPPSDVAPGGGTFPVDTSGNAYNPAWGSGGGFDWTGAALKGVGQFGQSLASGSRYTPPNLSSGGYYQSGVVNDRPQASGPIPYQPVGGGGGLDLIALLRRLGINL